MLQPRILSAAVQEISPQSVRATCHVSRCALGETAPQRSTVTGHTRGIVRREERIASPLVAALVEAEGDVASGPPGDRAGRRDIEGGHRVQRHLSCQRGGEDFAQERPSPWGQTLSAHLHRTHTRRCFFLRETRRSTIADYVPSMIYPLRAGASASDAAGRRGREGAPGRCRRPTCEPRGV